MNRLKQWVYKTFGKLDNPAELDGILIAIVSLLIILFGIAMKTLIL